MYSKNFWIPSALGTVYFFRLEDYRYKIILSTIASAVQFVKVICAACKCSVLLPRNHYWLQMSKLVPQSCHQLISLLYAPEVNNLCSVIFCEYFS